MTVYCNFLSIMSVAHFTALIQMLLDDFENNPKFCGWSDKIKTVFKADSISLQLATNQGCQPIVGEQMINGYWKLRPLDSLTVSVMLATKAYVPPISTAHT